MIKSITVINQLNDAVTLSLTDPWDTGLIITNITGLGPPKANINSTDLALGDGAVFNSSRIDKRNIVFHFQLAEVYEEDGMHVKETIEEVRTNTYRYFQLKKKHRLIFETDTRYVEIEGYCESNEPEIFSEKETAQVSFVCPNPFFTAKTKTIRMNGVNEMFTFPFSNEIATQSLIMGEFSENVGESIPYHGDVDSGVVMTITAESGGAKNVEVVNLNSEERFVINTEKIVEDGTVTHIEQGDVLTFSSMPGAKTAMLRRDGTSRSILPTISRTGQWLHLVNGDNVFAYSADEGAENISIQIEGYLLFEGV